MRIKDHLVKDLFNLAISKCEEDKTKTHDARGHKVQCSMSLALDQDSPDQDWNQFATFENDLENMLFSFESQLDFCSTACSFERGFKKVS